MRPRACWMRGCAPLLLAGAVAACTVEPHDSWPNVVRLIEPDPGELFEPDPLLAEDGLILDQDALETASRRPWKVDLGHDVRSCVLAPSGRIIEWPVSVPPSATLELSYAWLAAVEGSRTFQVSVREASGETLTVFKGTVPGSPDPSWHDAVVDLSQFARREVSVVLEIHGISGTGPGHGVPLWANPTVWAPGYRTHPNVILVSIDTLRADHLSLYGYRRSTTPNLEAWASRSAVTFRHTVAQATSTYPSHVSLFSGLNPFRHGVRTPLTPWSLDLVAERLRREGFLTVAVTGGAFLHPRLGLARGFDRFLYWPNRRQDTAELESGVEASIRLLRKGEQRPLFLFFHTYEVHHPYLPREPYYSSFLEIDPAPPITQVSMTRSRRFQPERGFIREPFRIKIVSHEPGRTSQLSANAVVAIATAAYDAGIAFTDSHLARLLDAAEKLTPRQPPVIVVTSDHGESLGEHGEVGHGSLSEDNLLVPLVIALSDRGHAGRSVEQQVRSIDILPTILDDLRLPVPVDIDGRSLLPLLRAGRGASSRPAWTYSSIGNLGLSLRLANRRKYILNNTAWYGVPEREALYDLDTDAAEIENLARRRVAEVADLRRRATRVLTEIAAGLRVGAHNGLDHRCSLDLAGGLLHLRAVKRDRLTGPELRWQEPEAASLVLGPGERTTLRFEDKGRTELHIRGATHIEGHQVTASLTVGPLTASPGKVRSWTLDPESGWLEVEEPPPRGCSISVWRRGPEASPAGGPKVAVDDDMQARLRALGYVE